MLVGLGEGPIGDGDLAASNPHDGCRAYGFQCLGRYQVTLLAESVVKGQTLVIQLLRLFLRTFRVQLLLSSTKTMHRYFILFPPKLR